MAQASPAPQAQPARPPGRIWGFMHALGSTGLPERVRLAGQTLVLQERVKHDFWAATGFYLDGAGQRVVMKFGRSHSFLGLPMRWAGRLLSRRESHFYRCLQDLPSVPRWLGCTEDETGFAHSFISGRPLSEVQAQALDDAFFAEFELLLRSLHARRMAYVDLHKPQNVIVGEDGRPYLIDFQISYDAGCGRLIPGILRRYLLRMATQADIYHLLKHKRRYRPDLLSDEDVATLEHQTLFIRIHRTLTQPYRWIRRRFLGRLRRSGRLLPEGSR